MGRFWKTYWKRIIALLALLAAGPALFLLLNVGGWRARVAAAIGSVYNWPVVVPPPANFQPQVPPGFKASVFASGFEQPRWLAIAPNGDVFVADSGAGEIIVLRSSPSPGLASREVFADHLSLPFGIAFHDDYVYAANTDQVARFRFDPKTSQRLSGAEPILALPGGGYHQHWTRSLGFSPDGTKLFVSVGSRSNVGIETDPRRAAILVMDPDGRNMRVYASGLRNAVGIAFNPVSSELWAAVNERDDLGDDVPSDYFTHVVSGDFYGWPYAYLGQHVDNRVSSRPDMVAKSITPDLLLGAHVAPLQFAFYDKQQFPPAYRDGAFIAEHGSWNRRIRSGYQVVFVPFHNGVPSGPPAPFFSGFVPDPAGKQVYGRPVGIAVTADGSLLIADDGQKQIWRVWYDADSVVRPSSVGASE
ncbi:MAG: sorbosone dehydrogenase family protein [Candidatus Acidiferrales bacterium]